MDVRDVILYPCRLLAKCYDSALRTDVVKRQRAVVRAAHGHGAALAEACKIRDLPLPLWGAMRSHLAKAPRDIHDDAS